MERKLHFRPGSSDERVLEEVLERRIYRRRKMNFDVESGELWLDLGANIGAFALYCASREAEAVCYEPEPDCFQLLRRNVPNFECVESAVTNIKAETIPFWTSRRKLDHYRGTTVPTPAMSKRAARMLRNTHAGIFSGRHFDGVKMDIEGSEGGIIDDDLIPECEKLVLEYHLSRDPSMDNLARRLSILRRRFEHVQYPPEFDRLIAKGKDAKTFFDRMIFCRRDS